MVLSASGTISRNCCLRIVRLIDLSAAKATFTLHGFANATIESDCWRMMEGLDFAYRGVEGTGTNIGWSLKSPAIGLTMQSTFA